MSQAYFKAVCLGVVAGMRAALAPALVSGHLSRQPSELRRLGFMASPRTAAVLEVMALFELLGDKLPDTPNRTEPGPLVGRVASGALCGAALTATERERLVVGAALGGLAAVAGSFAFYHLRRTLTHAYGAPDLLVALGEDALAVGGGLAALRVGE